MSDLRTMAGNRRTLFVLLGFALAIGLAYELRGVIGPLFFAFLIAYSFDPLVDRLEKSKVPRSVSAPLIILAVIAALLMLVFVGLPALVDQFAEAAQNLPQQLETLHARVDDFLWAHFHYKTPGTISEGLARYGAVLRDSIPDASQFGSVFSDTMKSVFALIGLLVVPMFAIYLLNDFNSIVRRAELLIPRRWAPGVTKVVSEIHLALGRYVRGQLICCLILAAIYSVALKLVGIRLAIPIGILTGMLAFIPYVGLATGMVLAAAISLIDFHSTGQVVAVFVVMGMIGLLDSMVITPRIVGGSVGLKPIEVLLTMMAAATLFGFLGVLVAVPLGAVLKILLRHALGAYVESSFYLEPPRHGAEEPPAPDVLDLRDEVPSLTPQGVARATETPVSPKKPVAERGVAS